MRTLRLLSLSVTLLAALSLTAPVWAAETKAAKTPVKTEKAAPNLSVTPLSIMVDQSHAVTFKTPASSVFIANPEIADIQVLSPTSLVVFGKKEGQTTLQVNDGNGNHIVYKTIIVTQNLANLREALRAAIPGSSIQVESLPDGVILSGTVSDPATVEDARRVAARYISREGDIINRIKVKANNQVQIRVRFAEVARDVDKRFGINWENSFSLGNAALLLATGADFFTNDSTAMTRTTSSSSTNDAIVASYRGRRASINGMIDALAENGLVTILAEPSLTALSGQTASFLAGGEFPVPIPQSGDTITIEWKQYGVSLAFTPTIIGDNRISLHVRPEVSQLSEAGSITLNNIAVPALTTRRAETTLELGSGQSFALGGLLNSQQTQSVSKYPFLGDIPVLGPLFRSSRFQNNETELVIIITPYIVKPTTQENLSLPTDGFAPPSDTDMFFGMRETNSDPNARTLSGESRTTKVEDTLNAEPAAPLAAPQPKVTKYQSAEQISARPDPVLPAITAPAPLKTATPSKATVSSEPVTQPIKPTPSGPGGFIVE